MRFNHSQQEDIKSFYKENGYVVIKDLFPKENLQDILRDIHALFETRFKAFNNSPYKGNELIVQEYQSKTVWRECASKMWDLFGVVRCAVSETVYNTLKELGCQSPIIATRPEIRIDMPNDEQYMQPWHQDWMYGQTSLNATTLWIPLQKVNKDNGTIDIIPKTHLLGLAKTAELSNPRRFVIQDDEFVNGKFFPLEMDLGEAVFFSQFLVHRSGHNITNEPRITFQARYADYREKNFTKNGYKDTFRNPDMQTMIPDIEEINSYFR